MRQIIINHIGKIKDTGIEGRVIELNQRTAKGYNGKFSIELRMHKDESPREKISLQKLHKSKKIDFRNSLFLAEYGKEYSSYEFSDMLKDMLFEDDSVDIWVANAWVWKKDLDHDESINVKFLSLSKMIFNHELALLMLAEQLYRFSDFTRGGNYTK